MEVCTMTEKKDDGYTTCPVCHGSGKNNDGSAWL